MRKKIKNNIGYIIIAIVFFAVLVFCMIRIAVDTDKKEHPHFFIKGIHSDDYSGNDNKMISTNKTTNNGGY